METKTVTTDDVLDTALRLAADGGWEAVRLHRIAEMLGVPLTEIYRHVRQKDDLSEALFDRADRAMLQAADEPEFRFLLPRERLHRVVMAWLEALAPYRHLVREMLFYKLEPPHLHLQVLGVLRVSRTVQWFLEAAGRRSTGLRRSLEEVAFTSLYLATFAYWLRDDSKGAERTQQFLRRRLEGLAGRSLFADEGGQEMAAAPVAAETVGVAQAQGGAAAEEGADQP